MASASDSFNRTNESPIAAPWVKQWVGGSINMNLVSNQVQSSAPGDSYYYRSGAATGPNQFSEVRYGSAITSQDFGPAVRIGSTGSAIAEGYMFDVYGGGTTGGISKHVNGVYSLVQACPIGTPAPTVGDVLRIEAEGTTIRGYVNGVLIVTGTDLSLTGAGNGPGLFIYENGGGLDNWKGGDLGSVVLQPTYNGVLPIPVNQTVHTFTGVVTDEGPNRCMVVTLHGEGSGGVVAWQATGITYGGVPLTRLGGRADQLWSWIDVWYLIAPPVGSASVVATINFADWLTMGVHIAQGVDQTTPLRAPLSTSSSGSTSTTLTVAGVASGDLVFDVLTIDSTGHAPAAGADQTERWDVQTAPGTSDCASSLQFGSAGGVMSYTWTTSGPYSYLASAFAPASVAPVRRPVDRRRRLVVPHRSSRRNAGGWGR